MKEFSDYSIRRKMMSVVALACTIAMILAGMLFFSYEFYSYRATMIQNTSTLAQIAAANSTAALSFKDETSARETLAALGQEPQVLSARILTPEGATFAAYARVGAPSAEFEKELPALDEGYRFAGNRLHLAHPIMLDGKRIGTLCMVSSLDAMYARLRIYGLIVTLVVIASVLVGLAATSRVQRAVSDPILELTATAKAVSGQKNYGLRVHRRGEDEIGTLADSFNAMLQQIQSRDVALLKTQGELELRVSEVERSRQRASFLAEAGAILSSALDHQVTLQTVARLAVPAFADWCIVDLIDESRQISGVAVAAALPEKLSLLEEMRRKYIPALDSDQPASRALRLGRAVLIEEFTPQSLRESARNDEHFELLRKLDPKSAIAAPMIAHFGAVGVITFAVAESGRRYGRADVDFAEEVARRAALAVDNARLFLQARSAQKIAESANKAKDDFLATLSHELRTPLTPMYGWIKVIRGRQCDAETLKRGLEVIERNITAESQLIEDILDVSRIIAGKLYLEFAETALNSVVEAALDTVRIQAEKKNIQLIAEMPPEPVFVSGDANRLQQIVWNLLVNAIKFTPAGGTVKVRAARKEQTAEIVVIDTGGGIESGFLPHIFERFKQADSSSTRAHGGLGLGLAIVAHLVERHNGSISAHSEGKGSGATFTVRLPALEKSSIAVDIERRPSGITARNELGGLHLLVVDDEPDARDFLRFMLEQHGADVSIAASVDEAVRVLTDEHIDIVLSDLAMPGQDGYMLMDRMKKLEVVTGRRVRAIALTAYAREEDRARAKQAGFLHHIAKPIDPNALFHAVLDVAGLR